MLFLVLILILFTAFISIDTHMDDDTPAPRQP
jgi:hypothetical protein